MELNLSEGFDTMLRFSVTPKPARVSKLPNQQHHLQWVVNPMFLALRLVQQGSM
jgi:hypothetical protein